jgi:hypothetical protein
MPALPAYGANISQPIRYSRACTQYRYCIDRVQLLTSLVFKQGYVALRLKSSLHKYHDLVDYYETSISQMRMDLLLFSYNLVCSSIIDQTCMKQKLYIIRDHLGSTRILVESVLLIFFFISMLCAL